MKLIASTLAAITFACAAIAVAQPTIRGPLPTVTTSPTDKAVPWQKQKGAEGDTPSLEFTTGAPKAMTCELMADAYEKERPTIAPGVATAPRDCATAGDAVADTGRQTGPTWGAPAPPVDSVVDGVATKYTMFHTEGAPVRATANVDLQEAGNAKQKGDGATVAAPSRVEQRPWRPEEFRLRPEADDDDEDDDDDAGKDDPN